MIRKLRREALPGSTPKLVFIYSLNCPKTGLARYVGKTDNPATRLKAHLTPRDREDSRQLWIDGLVSEGLKPVLEILDEVPAEEWPQWEVAYIQLFIESGVELLNQTVGGQ